MADMNAQPPLSAQDYLKQKSAESMQKARAAMEAKRPPSGPGEPVEHIPVRAAGLIPTPTQQHAGVEPHEPRTAWELTDDVFTPGSDDWGESFMDEDPNRVRQVSYELAEKMGMSPENAARFGLIMDLAPITGTIGSAEDTYQYAKQGNYSAAGLSALSVALDFVPLLGTTAAAGLRTFIKGGDKLDMYRKMKKAQRANPTGNKRAVRQFLSPDRNGNAASIASWYTSDEGLANAAQDIGEMGLDYFGPPE